MKLKENLKKGTLRHIKRYSGYYIQRLKEYCKLFVFEKDEVEDIIQDSFLALWEKRNSINIHRQIESYLFVILRNRCLNYLKNRRFELNHIPYEKLQTVEQQHLYELDLLEKEEQSLEERTMQLLSESINKLPPKMRDVFTKCKMEEKKKLLPKS